MTTDDFLESLRQDFVIEAGEYIDQIQDVLLNLEQGVPPEQLDSLVELIYRNTHSLKGAARSVNLPLIEQLCISLEDVWKKIRSKTLKLQPHMFDVFNHAVDLLRQLLADLRNGTNNTGPYQVEALRKQVEALQSAKPSGLSLLNDAPEPPPPASTSQDELIDHELIANDKTPVTAVAFGQPKAQATEKNLKPSKKIVADVIRVPLHKLEYLMSESEELLALHNAFEFLERQSEHIAQVLQNFRRHLAGNEQLMDELSLIQSQVGQLNRLIVQYGHQGLQYKNAILQQLQQLLMFPMNEVFDLLPRMVRDIANSRGKKVEVEINGADTGVDRRIIEGIKDPLIHLVRNCIDHGIELPAVRKAAGKPDCGFLMVKAEINGEGKLQITVSDDGAGIDTQKLKEKAFAMQLLGNDQMATLDHISTLNLIFASGLSTSDQVNEISGHGLGMSIVAEKIEALSGNIAVDSQNGKGTTFTITLPRVLSLFRGVLVREQDYHFLIPIQMVQKAMRVHHKQVLQVGAGPAVVYMQEVIPLAALSHLLQLPAKPMPAGAEEWFNLLVIRSGVKLLALQVESVIGEESGVVRPFEAAMGASDYFAGAMILSSGQMAFVMRPDVFADVSLSGKAIAHIKPEKPRHLLVAEDSLTVRNLLRNMLETAGYLVTTATDGQEAYQKLQKDTFDLVVSDVEMPKMNGFELTRKIRTHDKWKFLPVVLVTSLDSEDDKRKGMEAGASAYVTKGDFEKGNLLQILEQLLE